MTAGEKREREREKPAKSEEKAFSILQKKTAHKYQQKRRIRSNYVVFRQMGLHREYIYNYLILAHFDIRLCQTLFLAGKERHGRSKTYSHLPRV